MLLGVPPILRFGRGQEVDVDVEGRRVQTRPGHHSQDQLPRGFIGVPAGDDITGAYH